VSTKPLIQLYKELNAAHKKGSLRDLVANDRCIIVYCHLSTPTPTVIKLYEYIKATYEPFMREHYMIGNHVIKIYLMDIS